MSLSEISFNARVILQVLSSLVDMVKSVPVTISFLVSRNSFLLDYNLESKTVKIHIAHLVVQNKDGVISFCVISMNGTIVQARIWRGTPLEFVE